MENRWASLFRMIPKGDQVSPVWSSRVCCWQGAWSFCQFHPRTWFLLAWVHLRWYSRAPKYYHPESTSFSCFLLFPLGFWSRYIHCWVSRIPGCDYSSRWTCWRGLQTVGTQVGQGSVVRGRSDRWVQHLEPHCSSASGYHLWSHVRWGLGSSVSCGRCLPSSSFSCLIDSCAWASGWSHVRASRGSGRASTRFSRTSAGSRSCRWGSKFKRFLFWSCWGSRHSKLEHAMMLSSFRWFMTQCYRRAQDLTSKYWSDLLGRRLDHWQDSNPQATPLSFLLWF